MLRTCTTTLRLLETERQHDTALKAVLERLSKLGLTINRSKCKFNQSEITFWGMKFTAEGASPDPAKVDSLQYAVKPRNKEELRSFLGMAQTNADFIPNYSSKTYYMRQLLKNNTPSFGVKIKIMNLNI